MPYALVVLDLMLPGWTASSSALRQRQHSSQWNTPALVVSAHYNVEKLAASVGAEAFLAKPFTGADLTAAVHAGCWQPRAHHPCSQLDAWWLGRSPMPEHDRRLDHRGLQWPIGDET